MGAFALQLYATHVKVPVTTNVFIRGKHKIAGLWTSIKKSKERKRLAVSILSDRDINLSIMVDIFGGLMFDVLRRTITTQIDHADA